MQLTPHFQLDEFLASDTGSRLKIANVPTAEHLHNLHMLAEGMETVRTHFNRAIVITSGYRCHAINVAVGGVSTSDHALGFAADFHVAGWADFDAATELATVKLLHFDQLIYERGRCVHLSFNPRMRGQVLSQPRGPGTPVLQGIHR